MNNFNYKKYLAEGRLYENMLDVNVNDQDDYVEVTYNGESYKSALGDELVFIHYFKDGEYHGENDAPEIFKYLKGIGGDLLVDDEEATLTINMSNLGGNGALTENIDIAISKWGDIIMGGSYAKIPTRPVFQDIAELLDPVNDRGWSPEEFDDLMDIITHLKSNQSYINTTGEVSETWTYSPKGALGVIIVNFN